MATQWHPIFADLLRPLLEEFYEVQNNVPVGDVPREADLVLVRRTNAGPLPFKGIWRHLKSWNVFEYKGPSVSARLVDLDLLVELGLGIHRRLNSERKKLKQKPVGPTDVAFWYLVNYLGGRFMHEAKEKIGPLESVDDGIWRARVLGRELFLISGADVSVDRDSVPVHILSREALEKELAVARLVVEEDQPLSDLYLKYFGMFHSNAWEETQAMAKRLGKGLNIDVKPMLDFVGAKEVIRQVGRDRIIKELRDDIATAELELLIESLPPAKRAALKRSLEEKK